jgi:hypothetical protein
MLTLMVFFSPAIYVAKLQEVYNLKFLDSAALRVYLLSRMKLLSSVILCVNKVNRYFVRLNDIPVCYTIALFVL